ncbi:bifunctional UDP-N-acetylglucosamine diphosphorylase/glucosamine-1-phosphate N-acetyltransferase GlmU [Thermaurantiacus sp.]
MTSAVPLAAIILAAGRGTRMKSDLHKVLHPLGGQPMIFHLMQSLGELAPERTIVVVGDRADQVEAAVAPLGAEVVIQQPQQGTGHAVLQAEAALADFEGDTLILFGDCPFVSSVTLQRLRSALSDQAPLAVLGFRPADPGAYGRVIVGADGAILRMVEARDARPEELSVTLCNAGPMAVRTAHLWRLLKRVGNANAASEYYLPDIVMLAREEGLMAGVVEAAADEVAGINSRAELAAAEAAFQARRRAALMAAGVTLVAPETVYLSHDTEIGRDSLVEPFVVFGPGVRVAERVRIRAHSHLEGAIIGEDCEIGPFARLRPGTILDARVRIGNFVETKATHMGPEAKANHLAYLGDAEVGAGANIGAGTITCNYDGVRKHRTSIGAGAFIGSNSALIAPVRIGDGAHVGAGSAISRDVAPGALALTRAEQTERPGWSERFRAAMKARKERG